MAAATRKGILLKDIPPDLHRAAKVRAAQESITMKALVLKALEEYFNRAEKKDRK